MWKWPTDTSGPSVESGTLETPRILVDFSFRAKNASTANIQEFTNLYFCQRKYVRKYRNHRDNRSWHSDIDDGSTNKSQKPTRQDLIFHPRKANEKLDGKLKRKKNGCNCCCRVISSKKCRVSQAASGSRKYIG